MGLGEKRRDVCIGFKNALTIVLFLALWSRLWVLGVLGLLSLISA